MLVFVNTSAAMLKKVWTLKCCWRSRRLGECRTSQAAISLAVAMVEFRLNCENREIERRSIHERQSECSMAIKVHRDRRSATPAYMTYRDPPIVTCPDAGRDI